MKVQFLGAIHLDRSNDPNRKRELAANEVFVSADWRGSRGRSTFIEGLNLAFRVSVIIL